MAASDGQPRTDRPLRVLVIDGIGPFGGSSRSLFEALRALPAGAAEVLMLIVRGTVVPYYERVSHDRVVARALSHFDNTKYGYYRGMRWVVLLRELVNLVPTVRAVWAAKRRWTHVDVIHGNELTDLIPVLLARWLFRAPVVIHVRSLQREAPRSWRSRWIGRMLRRHVDRVVAIDDGVRATLPSDLPVEVIHNSFTPARSPTTDPALVEALGRLRPGSLKVGFVGLLHVSKGLLDLVAAADQAVRAGADLEFVIAGGATRSTRGPKAWALRTLRLAQDVDDQFEREVQARGLSDRFHVLGMVDDIQRVYESIDVICFPSHFDAPGRPVFEAAFSGVPSIVAVRAPRADTLVHGETGLAFPGRDIDALAAAFLHFSRDRGEVRRMGEHARALAQRNFEPRTNAAKLLATFRRVATNRTEHFPERAHAR